MLIIFRYKREYVEGKYSCFQRMIQSDEIAAASMVTMIADIVRRDGGLMEILVSDG